MEGVKSQKSWHWIDNQVRNESKRWKSIDISHKARYRNPIFRLFQTLFCCCRPAHFYTAMATVSVIHAKASQKLSSSHVSMSKRVQSLDFVPAVRSSNKKARLGENVTTSLHSQSQNGLQNRPKNTVTSIVKTGASVLGGIAALGNLLSSPGSCVICVD